MSLKEIQLFKEYEYDKAVEWHKNAEKLRKKFVEDYPIESLIELSLNDYAIGSKMSFCYRIKDELKDIASMGNVHPYRFGIYLKGGITATLSPTYDIYGDDYEGAFIAIKKDIIKLLEDTKKEDYKAIANSRLYKPFRSRLIITYFPGMIIPVVTETSLKSYFDRLGLTYDTKKDVIYNNITLRDWKNSVQELSSWSNEVFMSFCEWLKKKDKKIEGYKLKDEYYNNAKEVEDKIEKLNLQGIDKEAVVKIRVNQGIFKEQLLCRYSHCCLCNVTQKDFLIASHIKPWKDSDENERLDIDNGLLLCPNHDKAFDRGYISFDDNGLIIISDELDDINRVFLNLRQDMSIKLTDGNREYLKYHRKNIFILKR